MKRNAKADQLRPVPRHNVNKENESNEDTEPPPGTNLLLAGVFLYSELPFFLYCQRTQISQPSRDCPRRKSPLAFLFYVDWNLSACYFFVDRILSTYTSVSTSRPNYRQRLGLWRAGNRRAWQCSEAECQDRPVAPCPTTQCK